MTGSVDGWVRSYDLRMGQLRADYIGREFQQQPRSRAMLRDCVDPVTAVIPTQDGQSYLVTTLDSHVRLMDVASGKLLNDFTGHSLKNYRSRACFGHNEASVVCGDENGQVWAWDLLDVSHSFQIYLSMLICSHQANLLPPNPPPTVHSSVVLWTEHHPIEEGEMITASGDGTAKVWRHPTAG
jgi:mitogen-activated protein kinase organizer 1